MEKIEYLVVTITDADDKGLSKKLTTLGRQGWLFCLYKPTTMQFVFRRGALN